MLHTGGDDMEKYFCLFVILFFVFAVPVALYLILKPMFQQRKLLNGVINYDTFMRKIVFQIDFTNEFFIKKIDAKPIDYQKFGF